MFFFILDGSRWCHKIQKFLRSEPFLWISTPLPRLFKTFIFFPGWLCHFKDFSCLFGAKFSAGKFYWLHHDNWPIGQWVIFHAAPNTAYVIHFFPTWIYIYDSNPFRQNKSTLSLCRWLCHCATSCIKARFAHLYELMRGQLVASLTSPLVDEMHFVKVVCRKEDQIFWEEEAEKQIFLKVIRRFEHSFWEDKCVSMLFSKCFGQTFRIFLKFREISKYLINLGEWIWNWMALSSGIVAL